MPETEQPAGHERGDLDRKIKEALRGSSHVGRSDVSQSFVTASDELGEVSYEIPGISDNQQEKTVFSIDPQTALDLTDSLFGSVNWIKDVDRSSEDVPELRRNLRDRIQRRLDSQTG